MWSCSCTNIVGLWLRSADCATLAPFWHDEKLIVAYLAQGFPAFHGTLKVHYRLHKSPSLVLITTETKWLCILTRYLSANPLYLVSQLHLCPQIGLFPSGFRLNVCWRVACWSQPFAACTECAASITREHLMQWNLPIAEHLMRWNLPMAEPQGTGFLSELVCNCRRSCLLLLLLLLLLYLYRVYGNIFDPQVTSMPAFS